MRPTTEYFAQAIEAVKENKERYAAAEAQAVMQLKSPMAFMRSFGFSRMLRSGDDDE